VIARKSDFWYNLQVPKLNEEEKMDIGKAFAFVFEDQEWIVKILIGAAILLVGLLFSWLLLIPLILALALLAGYSVEVMRRVIHGQPDAMPEWENWGEMIADGLKAIVVGIVYALPFIVISACLGIPLGLLGDQSGSGSNALVSLLSAFLSCLNILWAIVISILLPAALAFWVADDELGAAFRFGEVFSFVRENFTTYLITFLMSWVASIVGSLGTILCGIGWFVTQPYSFMVTGHLYGQAYLQASGRAAQPAVADVDEFA
jgi:hypothetical protein